MRACDFLDEARSDPVDPIDALIVARFGDYDLDMATSGWCGTFALALYRWLRTKGYDPKLLVFCTWARGCARGTKISPIQKDDILSWRHVVVEVDGRLYDVHGRVTAEDTHANFSTDFVEEISEPELLRYLRREGTRSYSWRKLRAWSGSLESLRA